MGWLSTGWCIFMVVGCVVVVVGLVVALLFVHDVRDFDHIAHSRLDRW